MSPPADGYTLVLECRVVGFTKGRAIRCLASSPAQRPDGGAAVPLDKVAFEDTAGGVLGAWQSS